MLERRINSDGLVYYASTLLERLNVPHAFSTRIGGVSAAPFNSLNLGNPSGCAVQDDDALILENYRLLQSAIRCENKTRISVHQVHGNAVADARSGVEHTSSTKADAIITDYSTRVLSIRTADCAPVLIANEDGSLVAAIHAGWRGVIAGVVPNTLRRMCDAGCAASELTAAVGPCIGCEAFEVGLEVVEEFERTFGNDAPIQRVGNSKGRVDLKKAILLQLQAAGVSRDRIDVSDRCTFRDQTEFFSHRRDNGISGRMASLIAPRLSAKPHKGSQSLNSPSLYSP